MLFPMASLYSNLVHGRAPATRAGTEHQPHFCEGPEPPTSGLAHPVDRATTFPTLDTFSFFSTSMILTHQPHLITQSSIATGFLSTLPLPYPDRISFQPSSRLPSDPIYPSLRLQNGRTQPSDVRPLPPHPLYGWQNLMLMAFAEPTWSSSLG